MLLLDCSATLLLEATAAEEVAVLLDSGFTLAEESSTFELELKTKASEDDAGTTEDEDSFDGACPELVEGLRETLEEEPIESTEPLLWIASSSLLLEFRSFDSLYRLRL